jgi:Tfp pilus assembly major pilin PilA
MRKFFEIGGLLAGVVLVAFGIAAIVMGINGRSTVNSSLKQEQIVGTPDMTPAGIAAEAKQAGLPATIKLPTVAVAGKAIDNGDRARAFATYMRIHALEATGGLTYAQMPRYASKDGKGTNDAAAALKGSNGQPVSNAARQVWIDETALSTALNTSYMASQLALFGVVIGVALLLSGLGFMILAIGGALRNPETSLGLVRHLGRRDQTRSATATT